MGDSRLPPVGAGGSLASGNSAAGGGRRDYSLLRDQCAGCIGWSTRAVAGDRRQAGRNRDNSARRVSALTQWVVAAFARTRDSGNRRRGQRLRGRGDRGAVG